MRPRSQDSLSDHAIELTKLSGRPFAKDHTFWNGCTRIGSRWHAWGTFVLIGRSTYEGQAVNF